MFRILVLCLLLLSFCAACAAPAEVICDYDGDGSPDDAWDLPEGCESETIPAGCVCNPVWMW